MRCRGSAWTVAGKRCRTMEYLYLNK